MIARYFLFFSLIPVLFLCGRDFRVDEWEQTKYIWDFGLISLCNKGVPPSPIAYFQKEPEFDLALYQGIQGGDIVWVRCLFIPRFFREVLPQAEGPFVVVISDGDESFPADCPTDFDIEEFIRHEKVGHIFTQNYDYHGASDKVSRIPIGMDFHTIGYKSSRGGWGVKGTPLQQEEVLKNLLKAFPPTYSRKKRIFADFQHSDTMHGGYQRYLQFGEDRTSIYLQLLATGLIDCAGFMPRDKLWKTKGQYAFSVSPHGNGLDCHRTWEDLVLGCIVIVKTSPLDPLYEGLPVVIVSDWSEVTEENLEHWIEKYGDAFSNPLYREKLTTLYWFGEISAKQAEL